MYMGLWCSLVQRKPGLLGLLGAIYHQRFGTFGPRFKRVSRKAAHEIPGNPIYDKQDMTQIAHGDA